MNKIKVSVCVVTYNQEKYIRQCLKSLVDQKTNFNFEIIVGDDGSTDSTRVIINEFKAQFPNLIRVIFHDRNYGGAYNYLSVHQCAEGEYIAHVDGDDYALPGKLQTQADYLDKHPRCNILFHRVKMKFEGYNLFLDDLINLEKFTSDGFTRSDLLMFGSIGANSSKMYRASVREIVQPPFTMLDYFTNVEQIGNGTANYLNNEFYGVYRVGVGVVDTTKILFLKSLEYFFQIYPEHKRQISANALLNCLVNLKNLRFKMGFSFLKLYFKSFSFLAVVDLWMNRKIINMLKLPKIKS